MDASYLLISLLNGLSGGLLLFMMASGLTLIFSMMGVLNFAHAGFYMLGAYVAAWITGWAGFWWALCLAPALVGLAGAGFEHGVLRRVHRFGHMAELLATFGLSYVLAEGVALLWGRSAVAFAPPQALQGPLFTLVEATGGGLSVVMGSAGALCRHADVHLCTQFPAFRAFGMGLSLLILAGLWWLLARTRIGLIVRAALTQAAMVEALGHNVPRVFMAVFGVGTALAALAGVIDGALRVTEPSMGVTLGALVFAVIVIGGVGSLAGAFVASMVIGLLDALAVGSQRSLGDLPGIDGLAASVAPALLTLKLSQIAAVLPFALLVLVLVVRPGGLLGSQHRAREG